jgi:S-adenosylmethionine hydrolase
MIDGHIFVGPDNGLFGLVMSGSKELHVRHATSREYFRENVSSTFHGRDIFAPLAAHLDSGLDLTKVGPEISDYKKLALPQPLLTDVAGTIVGEVIHIDRFGNCVTNLTLNEDRP